MTHDDNYYMQQALLEARKAQEEGEIPIGAVVVSPQGNIIGRGHNLTETLHDVTAHAEMQALTAAADYLGEAHLDTVEALRTLAGRPDAGVHVVN